MSTLCPNPKFRAFDASGAPLVGGQLGTFVAGTTTPLATYTDSSQGTANTNPVLLDFQGEADVWLAAGQSYKLVLSDQNGVIQWSVDNVTSDLSAALAQLANNTGDPSTDGASLIGVQVGTQGRTLHDRAADDVTVKDYGAIGDGLTDDTAACAAMVADVGYLVFPAGNFRITQKITFTGSDVAIRGKGEASMLSWAGNQSPANTLAHIFEASSVNEISIADLAITDTSTSTNMNLFHGINVQGVRISNVLCHGLALAMFDAAVGDYPSVVVDTTSGSFNGNADIVINNCRVVGKGGSLGQAAVLLSYCSNWEVTGCVFSNILYGVQFWGGDAASDGSTITAERKNKNGTISGCTHINGQAGFWGSMGVGIVISGCTVRTSSDVGIDMEGSANCTITGNHVSHAGNGCFAGFFLNQDVAFIGNTAYQDGTLGAILFRGNNSNQNPIPRYLLSGNTFRYGGASGAGQVFFDPGLLLLTFEDNQMINTRFVGSTLNSGTTVIRENSFNLTNALTAGQAIISVGGNSGGGSCIIDGNLVISTATNDAASFGILVAQGDSNNAVLTLVQDNTVSGFTISIKTTGDSPNAGIVWTNLIRGNVMSGTYVYGHTAAKANSYLDGNRTTTGGNYPSAVPGSGYWAQGNRIYIDNPAASGTIGSVCVTAGSPGTWKTFGTISA